MARPLINGALTAVACLSIVSSGFAEARRTGNYFLFRKVTPAIQLTAWVPDTNATVRGLIYLGCHGDGADVTWWVRGEGNDGRQIRNFCRAYGFGVLGGNNLLASQFWSQSDPQHRGPMMQYLDSAFQQFAALGHPEFAHIPLIPFGCSNGGVTAWSVTNILPSQVICATPDEFHTFAPSLMTDAALAIPTLASHVDGYTSSAAYSSIFRDGRGRGGLVSWWLQYHHGHCEGPLAEIEVPFWEKCIRARYPASSDPAEGPVAFNSMSEDGGWAVDTTWRNGLTGIQPFATYSGPRNAVGWAPDSDMAHLYRCMASWGSMRFMEVYYDGQSLDSLWPVVPPGARIRLEVSDSVRPITGFTRVEFFNGATKLGEVTAGAPELEVTLASDGPVAQTFSAIIHLPGPVVRATDHPKCLLVTDTTVSAVVWPDAGRGRGKRTGAHSAWLAAPGVRVFDMAGRAWTSDASGSAGVVRGVAVVRGAGGTGARVVVDRR